MERFKQRLPLIILIIISILLIGLMVVSSNNQRELTLGESVVGDVLKPVQSLITSISTSISGFFVYIDEFKGIRESYYQLIEELKQYEKTTIENEELKQENQRLKKLLNFKEEHEQYVIQGARVIAKDPNHWYGSLTIDKGSNDQVSLDMAVMTEEGLIGRVVEVAKNWSRVEVLVDSKSAVSAIVQRTRDEGIVKGSVTSMTVDNLIRMVYIPTDSAAIVGDIVVTSGFGDIFPKGLNIGTIVSIEKNEYDAYITAIIEPNVDFSKVEEVIIVSEKGE